MTESLNPVNKTLIEQYKDKVLEGSADSYMLTIARDGESPARSIYFYSNAIDAANGYEAYRDWGFARDFLTVELHEPTGRVHSKILNRPRGGECVFHRQQYREVSSILLKASDSMKEETRNYLIYELAKLFSKDNQRFDVDRFFADLGYTGEINDKH